MSPLIEPIGGIPHVQHRKTDTQAFRGAAEGANPSNPGADAEQALFAEIRASDLAACTPAEDAGENASIEVGEIIAWRAWRLREDRLLASIHINKTVWFPDSTVSGNVNNICGVHGFKSQRDAIVLATHWAIQSPTVVGQVALWGKVIEHELGYRASYACVHSLDILFSRTGALKPWFWLWQNRRLRQVRERYGVGAASTA